MMTLIMAAVAAAAQPAPAPMPQGQAMPMNHEQHAAMKEKCCCDDMGKAGHDMHAPKDQSRDHHSE
ncbi:MAG TPA: hypothetical protein VFG41_05490 [Sphingomicrobium sp.]|jgi:hypothetical protein|nr:hypothetical protein [Sphingomicrobium sp.]